MATLLPPITSPNCPCVEGGQCGAAPLPSVHNPYHTCTCYGHDMKLPDYKNDIAVPRTLQNHYAKKGGCPCPPEDKWHGGPEMSRYCPQKSLYPPKNQKKDYRDEKGHHHVFPEEGPNYPRDPVTGVRSTFPNRRNYGGRHAACLTTAPQLLKRLKNKQELKLERARDRKNFLEAVLRDEIIGRIEAEDERGELEGALGLLGSYHVQDYQQRHGEHSLTGLDPRTPAERGVNEFPTVAKQYAEIMEELHYTAQQPVGLKYNIIRLHYLLEEQERLNNLRFQSKMQQRENDLQKRLEQEEK